jgi:hypothetical protein
MWIIVFEQRQDELKRVNSGLLTAIALWGTSACHYVENFQKKHEKYSSYASY